MNDPTTLLLAIVGQNIILLVAVLGLFWAGIALRRARGASVSYSLAPLGFRKPTSGYAKGIALGLAVGFGAVVAGAVLNVASLYGLRAAGYPADPQVQQPLMEGLRSLISENPVVAIPAVFAIVAVLGPAVEELVFRGAIFGGLRSLGARLLRRPLAGRAKIGAEGISVVVAAVLSSAFFASLHLEPIIFLSIFALAVGLCLLLRRTGSLVAPIAAHVTFNSFTVVLVALRSLEVIG